MRHGWYCNEVSQIAIQQWNGLLQVSAHMNHYPHQAVSNK